MDHDVFQLLHEAASQVFWLDRIQRLAARRILQTLLRAWVGGAHDDHRGQGRGIGVDHGRAGRFRRTVQGDTRRYVVSSVDNHWIARRQIRDLIDPICAQALDLDLGVDAPRRRAGDFGLVLPDGVGEGEDLTVHVGGLEDVDVADGEPSDARADQGQETGAPHAADACDERGAHLQGRLFRLSDEAQIAGGELGIVEGRHVFHARKLPQG